MEPGTDSSRGGRPPGEPPPLADSLHERMKELSCLYEVAAAFVEHRDSFRDCTRRIVGALTRAMRFPDQAEAGLRIDDLAEHTPGFGPAGPRLSNPIRIAGEVRGELTVGYRANGPSAPDFLREEESLVQTVARQIGVFAESVEAQARRLRMEEQLRHADRLATIGQLAAGVAHELNEPLANILGFAQLAQKADHVPEQVRSDLDKIVRATLHGREIIRKLLVFARQAPASKASVNLNVIIEDALFLLEAGCENPGIRFLRELRPDLPEIEADPVQMRQTIVNLVVNAIQAISGDGFIHIRTRHAAGDGIELEVQDTGIGMPHEVATRVFDPFFTTKDVGEGTGLGLSVVQGIVAAHAGSISVDTQPGRGSRFTVRLPRTAPPQS